MPKATVSIPSGAKVTVEGTDDEIVGLVARLEGLGQEGSRSSRTSAAGRSKLKGGQKPTLIGLITEMIEAGFFKEPKPLGALKEALEQNGQFYPVTRARTH